MKIHGPVFDRFGFILEHSARLRSGAKILHIGCTTAPNTEVRWATNTLLHKALCDQGAQLQHEIVGIDIDESAVQWLRGKMPGKRIIVGDAHRLATVLPHECFDFIIAGDVIEHLPNPGLFLEACKSVLVDNGEIALTTINSFGVVRFFKALFNHEAVHADHVAYYSMNTLKRLGEINGLRVLSAGYSLFERQLSKGGINGFLSCFIERGICMIFPQYAEGVVSIFKVD